MGNPDMALIGMDVMGGNFVQNFAEKGYDIAMWNRTDSKTEARHKEAEGTPYHARLHPVVGNLDELVKKVGPQGTYMVMIKAGDPTINTIRDLKEMLQPGAIVVDCANSHWPDTVMLCEEFKDTGIAFFGMGVSGGEEGARHGPSMMIGGTSREIYEKRLKEAFEKVAAKACDGSPCVAYCGNLGAGHFVKMVHNAIEYADMQLIAETYDMMRSMLGMDAHSIGDVFDRWNTGPLQSYLIEITATVLHQKDEAGKPVVDRIVDAAQMKGTGTWTVLDSLQLLQGVEPIPTIYAAVASRAMSAKKEDRVAMEDIMSFQAPRFEGDPKPLIASMEKALYTAKISAYNQGIALLERASEEYGFGDLDIGEIARIWRAGCIIRAQFLDDITKAYKETKPRYLMAAPYFKNAIKEGLDDFINICSAGLKHLVPMMAFHASIDYTLQLARAVGALNITQGERDLFGAHTVELDRQGPKYHIHWGTKTGDIEER